MSEPNWEKYYEETKEAPPRQSLVRAIEFIQNKEKALDLGSGALNDTRYLLSIGFEHVTAVDKTPVAEQEVEKLPGGKVSYEVSSFEDFDFQENTYDLINAQYSLPFTSKENFNGVFNSVIKSLKLGGVFVGQFFGDRDEWNIESKHDIPHKRRSRNLTFRFKNFRTHRRRHGWKNCIWRYEALARLSFYRCKIGSNFVPCGQQTKLGNKVIKKIRW